MLTLGAIALVGVGVHSFLKRSDEAFAAGQTDRAGSAGLAALGDMVGVTNIVEGFFTGQDAVTDRVLGTQERSERLGTGIGTFGTLVLGPKAWKFGGAMGAAPKAPEGFPVDFSGSGPRTPAPPENPLGGLSEAELDAALEPIVAGQYYRTPVSATEAGFPLENMVPVSRWGKPGLRPGDWIVPGPPGAHHLPAFL